MFNQWLQQLTQPNNREAFLGLLAKKGAPPPEVLQAIQAQGPPQMSQIPGAPDSFVGMLQQAGAPGMVPMQPGADGNLMPVPPPQMSINPDMPQGPAPIPFAPEAAGAGGATGAALTAMQLMKLMGENKGQEQEAPRPPPPPGLMSGVSVRPPEMLQAGGQKPGGRASLAQLIYGR